MKPSPTIRLAFLAGICLILSVTLLSGVIDLLTWAHAPVWFGMVVLLLEVVGVLAILLFFTTAWLKAEQHE